MSGQHEHSAAARDYAAAYESHHAGSDLLKAFRSYENVISVHPQSPEADYSRSQIRNIASQVVPADELLKACIDLTVHHLESEGGSPAAGKAGQDT